MYDKCILYTYDEQLFEKVSFERAIEIIKNDEVLVLDCELSHNTYGEFLFIHIRHQDTVMCMYGLGEHIYRERWVDNFSIDTSDLHHFKDITPLDKTEVIKRIFEREKEKERYQDIEQTESGRCYDLLAEIGDEDGAATMIDDCYEYFMEN